MHERHLPLKSNQYLRRVAATSPEMGATVAALTCRGLLPPPPPYVKGVLLLPSSPTFPQRELGKHIAFRLRPDSSPGNPSTRFHVVKFTSTGVFTQTRAPPTCFSPHENSRGVRRRRKREGTFNQLLSVLLPFACDRDVGLCWGEMRRLKCLLLMVIFFLAMQSGLGWNL